MYFDISQMNWNALQIRVKTEELARKVSMNTAALAQQDTLGATVNQVGNGKPASFWNDVHSFENVHYVASAMFSVAETI